MKRVGALACLIVGAAPAASPAAATDISGVIFGIGVLSGNNNVIEENSANGNTNGIVVFAAATNTRIRGNVAVGNAPIQQSVAVNGRGGVDIWDQSPAANNNVFTGNVCLTAINAAWPEVSAGAVPRKPGS